MPYAGLQLMQRDVAALAVMATIQDGKTPFANRKVEAVAVVNAESHRYVGAWHDNEDGGRVVSRDCGLAQINIPARLIDSETEADLRYIGTDRDAANQVALNNLRAAADLFMEPWTKRPHREWQPWVAYTQGWATYPEAWVWSHVNPGTWAKTGRYLHTAISGVANYHRFSGHLSPEKALEEAERLASLYGITKGSMDLAPDTKLVRWHFPPMPAEAGSAADYPKPNNGASLFPAK